MVLTCSTYRCVTHVRPWISRVGCSSAKRTRRCRVLIFDQAEDRKHDEGRRKARLKVQYSCPTKRLYLDRGHSLVPNTSIRHTKTQLGPTPPSSSSCPHLRCNYLPARSYVPDRRPLSPGCPAKRVAWRAKSRPPSASCGRARTRWSP